MPQATNSHLIKVTGITDNLLRLLDEQVKQRHFNSRAEYVRELIRQDILGEGVGNFRDILAPVHALARKHSKTEEELEAYFNQIREKVYQERKVAPKQ